MSYGDDFATVDVAGAPLDPIIMIGADPVFWGALLLLLLAAGLAGYHFGSRSNGRRVDAASSIWEAINEAAKAAMKADTDALPAHATQLQRVLRARLGRTLDFGGALKARVDALDHAIDGESGDDGDGGPDDPAGEDAPAARPDTPAPASSAAANVTIVSVHPAAPVSHDPARPKHGRRAMSTRQRNDALRLAVAAFNDYWRHRSAREADMRAVVAELCDPGPRRPHLSHSGDHH